MCHSMYFTCVTRRQNCLLVQGQAVLRVSALPSGAHIYNWPMWISPVFACTAYIQGKGCLQLCPLSLLSDHTLLSSKSFTPILPRTHVVGHWSKALSPSGHTVDALKTHSCYSAAYYTKDQAALAAEQAVWGWGHWGTGAFSRLQRTLGDTFPSGQLRDDGKRSRWP